MFGEEYADDGTLKSAEMLSSPTAAARSGSTFDGAAAAAAHSSAHTGGAGASAAHPHSASKTSTKSNARTLARPPPSSYAKKKPIAPNVLRLNSDDEEPGHMKSVEEIINELDAEQEVGGPKGGCCSRVFVPFLAIGLAFVIFVAAVMTSGSGVDMPSTPRVAVVVMEGFKGTIFTQMVQSGLHLPNIEYMLTRQGGVYAACPTVSDSRCARAVTVEDDVTGDVYVYSGSSIASILSGVSPRLHMVRNDTLSAYRQYTTTAKTYPSIAKRVVDAGRRVTVMGSSHLLNAFASSTGRCTEPGVLDMECPATDVQEGFDPYNSLQCLQSSSCNAQSRQITLPTDPTRCSDGDAERLFTRQINEIFGALELTSPEQKSAVQNNVADSLDESLMIFHFDALAVRADSASLPDFRYDSTSREYHAQAFLLDALVGQVLAYVKDRARTQKENWLVIGVSDHGGKGKTFGTFSDDDDVIPFFLATYTSNAQSYVKLSELAKPTSQLDVLPTVLRWLNIAPFDDATMEVVAATNTTPAPPEVEAQAVAQRQFEGKVQGICSAGTVPLDCRV